MAKEQTLNLRFKVTDEGTVILDAISKKITNIDQASKSMSASLGLIKFQALVSLGQTAINTARQMGEFLQIGARAKQVEESFNMIAEASGVMGSRLIENMKRASGVFVEETDIMIKAQRLLLEGMDETTIVKLTEAARLMGRTMGIDVADAFDRLTDSLISMRTRGIAPAFPTIKEAEELFKDLAKSYGVNVDELTLFAKRQALVEEVLRVTNERLQMTGELLETESEKLQKYRSAWDQLKESVSKTALSIIGSILTNRYEPGPIRGIEYGKKPPTPEGGPIPMGEWPSETRYINYVLKTIEEPPIADIVDHIKRLENAFKELGIVSSDDLEKKIKRTFENIKSVIDSGKGSVTGLTASYKQLFGLLENLKPIDMQKKLGEVWNESGKKAVEAQGDYETAARRLREETDKMGEEGAQAFTRGMAKLVDESIEKTKAIRKEMETAEKGIRMTFDADYAKEQVRKLIEEIKNVGIKVPIEFEPPTEGSMKIWMDGVLYTWDQIKDKVQGDPVVPEVETSRAEIEMDGVLYKYNSVKDEIEKRPIQIKTEGGESAGGANVWGLPIGDFFGGGGAEGSANINFFGTGSTKKPISEKIQEIINQFGGLDKAIQSFDAMADFTQTTSEISKLEKQIATLQSLPGQMSSMASYYGGSPYVGQEFMLNWQTAMNNLMAKLEEMQMRSMSQMLRTFGSQNSMQSGGYVPRTGLYRLHEGEKVVPKNISAAMTNNIYISGNNPREIAEAVKKALKYNLTDLGQTIKGL